MKIRQITSSYAYGICLPARFFAIISVCIAFLLAKGVSAQISLDGNFTIEKYNDEKGLPQNTVRSVFADKRGFVWLATEFGLVRFDGENFRIYNSENTPAIKSNRIMGIAKNMAGYLLIMDGFSNLSMINEKKNRIDLLMPAAENIHYLFSERHLLFTHPLTPGDSFVRKQFEAAMRHSFKNAFGDGDAYYCPVSDAEGYVITRDSIVYLGKRQVKKVCDLRGTRFNLPIFFKKKNDLYVYEKGHFIEIKNGHKTSTVLKIEGDFVHTRYYLEQPTDNVVYSCYEDSALLFLEGSAYALTIIDNVIQTKAKFKIADKEITSFIHLPAYDTYILGTRNEGLQILRKRRFATIKNDVNRPEANNFYAQARLNKTTILTHVGLLDIQKRKIVRQIAAVHRYSMMRTKKGLVVYAVANRLYMADSALNTISEYEGGDVRALTEDSLGRIWYGLYEDLFCISTENERGLLKRMNAGIGYIEAIYEYDKSTLWIGTRQGIYKYDIGNNTTTLIGPTKNLYVRNIYRSRDGNIWIGTYGQGFYLYKYDRFVKMPLDENRHLATAHCFIEDVNGFFWIPTNKGLFKVLKQELYDFAAGRNNNVYYYYFDKSNGFNTNEFNGGCKPCSVVLDDGTVSLPSLDGLVWFNPASVKTPVAKSEILIDKVIFGDTNLSYTGGQLQFPSHAKDITIELYIPFFGDRSNLQFEYRINGDDTVWKKIYLNKILLSNLPSGNHILTIRNRKDFGTGNYAYKKLSLLVGKKWYEKIYFSVLFFLLFILVIVGLSELRLRYAGRKNKALESQVAKRTQELNYAMEKLNTMVGELQHSEKELQKSNELKDKLASILAHDLKSAVRFTSTLSSHLHRKITARQYDENLSEITSDLSKTTRETYLFIEQFLVWISSQRLQYQVHRELLDLALFTQELQNFFEEVVSLNRNKIYFDAEPCDEIITDRQILKIIVRNLIDNSNKYTKNGHIYVTGSYQHDKYIIVVKDTGKGIAQKVVEKLTNPGSGEEAGTSKGLGYKIIMDLINLIHVTIHVESTLNKGTAVTLEIPLRQEAEKEKSII